MNMPNAQKTDQALLALLNNDDAGAFQELYRRYWRKLYVVAANRIANEHDAEEIVQDIFTSLWLRRGSINITEDGIGKYLAASVKYRVIKTLNKYAQQHTYLTSIPSSNCIDNSTQEWLAFEALKDELSLYVKNLPEKCQIVFRLSREKGYSQKQIAAELSISEKTVEAHLQKAFKILRSKIAGFMLMLF